MVCQYVGYYGWSVPVRGDVHMCISVYVHVHVEFESGKITKKRLKETTAEAREITSGLLAGTPNREWL